MKKVLMLPALGCAIALNGFQSAHQVSLHLNQTQFPMTAWGSNNQMQTCQGQLVVNGLPVTHAKLLIHFATATQVTETNQNGAFSVLLDTSNLTKITVTVNSLAGATVQGKAISPSDAAQLLHRSVAINVVYPITIKAEKPSPDGLVRIDGKLSAPGDVPVFLLDKYVLKGKVYAANHRPLLGAIVSFTNDGGEGWAQSAPSAKDGSYEMTFIPQSDSNNSFRVSVGSKQYTLPNDKYFLFPENTSSDIDVTLPRTGTTIVDRPPTLIARTIRGATYNGVVIGVDVPKGVSYSTTAVRADGSFTLKMPVSVWKQHPALFESTVDRFFPQPVVPGQLLTSSWIHQQANDPSVSP